MKTIKIIAIAAAVTALAACTKEQGTDNGSSFKKGQEVTLSITADIPATKVTSALNSDGATVDFKWEDGDQIKITVDDSSSVFTLVGDAGTSSAHFEGKMPESGTKFDIQYPVEEPDLTSQSYTAGEAVPHGMMKFTATGCSLGDATFNIEPQNALLRLNLYGKTMTVSKIVVTNTSSSAAYTLNISGGKTLSTDSSNPTPFFVVVPAGEWNFSAEVFDNASTPESICTLEKTSTDAYFAANTVLTMPAAKVAVFSPVIKGDFTINSSGTKVMFSKGNLQAKYSTSTSSYSWGFAENQYDYIGNAAGNTTIDSQTDGAVVDLFGWSTSATYYGISTSEESTYSGTFVDWGGISGLPSVAGRTWRTLTGGDSGEWKYLLDTRSVNGGTGEGKSYQIATINSDGTGVYGLIIYPDNYTSQTGATTYTSSEWAAMESAGCVFLPTTGLRSGSKVIYLGTSDYHDIYCQYWSATNFQTKRAYCLYFTQESIWRPADYAIRNYGSAVRLVSVAL